MKTLTQMFNDYRDKKRAERMLRETRRAEKAVNVREYNGELWFSLHGLPLVRISELGMKENDWHFKSILDDARANFIRFERE